MEILTFASGLVVGAITIAVELGNAPAAQLRLDGVPVCDLTQQTSSCRIDLGLDLRVHRLDLLTRNAADIPVVRATRWVNRPGAMEAEARIRERCDDAKKSCTFDFGWLHPDRLWPERLAITLDGKRLVRKESDPPVRVSQDGKPHVVSVEVAFPDGRKASASRVLGSRTTGETGAALQCVPIELVDCQRTDAPRAGESVGGLKVHATEIGESEVIFIEDPTAPDQLFRLERLLTKPIRSRLENGLLELGYGVTLEPRATNDRFPAFAAPENGPWRLRFLLLGLRASSKGRLRLADSVASAGLLGGGSRRRRVVVLVLGDGHDESAFTARETTAYLSQVMVPLLVWRSGSPKEDGWPKGQSLRTEDEAIAAVTELRRTLDCQRLAWLEGEIDPGSFALNRSESRFTLAGRD